jgi:hypothetical protein
LYIDGYAGSRHHVSKARNRLVEGSPLIALNTNPPFHEYHFIDDVPSKVFNQRFAEAFWTEINPPSRFKYVPKPMPMRTKTNTVIYYLYIASQKEAGMDT